VFTFHFLMIFDMIRKQKYKNLSGGVFVLGGGDGSHIKNESGTFGKKALLLYD